VVLRQLIGEDMYYQAKLEAARRRSQQEHSRSLEIYRTDPTAYAAEVLKVTWWLRQMEIALAVRDHQLVLVQAPFGVGKTHVAAGLTNWWFDTQDGSVVLTTAPTFPQVRDLLWRQVRSQRKTKPDADTVQIVDPDNPLHYAIGRSPQRRAGTDDLGSQAFQGTHAKKLLVIFDEAAGVGPDRWATAESLIVGSDNKMLVIGNPIVTSGPFFTAARDGRWHVIRISGLEHPNIAAGLAGEPEPFPGAVSLNWLMDKLNNNYWCKRLGQPAVDEERETWKTAGAFEFPPGSDEWYQPTPVGEAKILGRFPSWSTDTVWSAAWLEAAFVRVMDLVDTILQIGIDVARFGDDSTSLHGRQGPCSLVHETWAKTGLMETVGQAKHHIDDLRASYHPPKTIVRVDIGGGLGAGPAERLEELYRGDADVIIEGVDPASKPIDDEKFINRRSELWFQGAALGEVGTLDLSRLPKSVQDELLAQLTAPKFKYDSQSRQVVESKDDLKKRIGRSPDDADAFNLAYASGDPVDWSAMKSDDLRRQSTWGRTDAAETPRSVPQEPGDWSVPGGGRYRGRM